MTDPNLLATYVADVMEEHLGNLSCYGDKLAYELEQVDEASLDATLLIQALDLNSRISDQCSDILELFTVPEPEGSGNLPEGATLTGSSLVLSAQCQTALGFPLGPRMKQTLLTLKELSHQLVMVDSHYNGQLVQQYLSQDAQPFAMGRGARDF